MKKRNAIILSLCITSLNIQVSEAIETNRTVEIAKQQRSMQQSIQELSNEIERIKHDLEQYAKIFKAAKQDAIFMDQQVTEMIKSFELCAELIRNDIAVKVCNRQTEENFMGIIREKRNEMEKLVKKIESSLKKAELESQDLENLTKLKENIERRLNNVEKIIGVVDKYSGI